MIVVVKGTCQVNRLARRGGVVLGAVDPSVTAVAGVVLVGDVERVLGIVGAIDGEVGRLGPRAGWSGGELLFSAAEVMLGGGDFMVDLDHARGCCGPVAGGAPAVGVGVWFVVSPFR